MSATGYTTDARAVTSVEGQIGAVDLDADDVGAATAAHNHDGTYSAAAHNHSGTYAAAAHTHAAGAWTVPFSYAANMSSVGSPYYTVGSRTQPNDEVRLRGRIGAGANYTSGQTICTLDVSARPVAEVAVPVRVVGVGAANGSLTITTGGLVSYSANITVGAGTAWLLDGITYTLTA